MFLRLQYLFLLATHKHLLPFVMPPNIPHLLQVLVQNIWVFHRWYIQSRHIKLAWYSVTSKILLDASDCQNWIKPSVVDADLVFYLYYTEKPFCICLEFKPTALTWIKILIKLWIIFPVFFTLLYWHQ